ncbi:sulfotransferase family 2 domain-containing protein [Roseisalinus antarcticus]|uniref:Sulfotransferase family protein n=1 Tax=Roseisalinus antarcticus TaxID=254357 RepID=A0A1Y5THC4_9RHOB|nr:sulfotransferase family 2 domain-containing protein [Roseisalinus antarcticus]SLN64278.1 Sulfotransferase family protein [Roseisalinus antarcticus]
MGLVDIAKRLRHRATERLLPQPFVFHHVPKCGGTSVGRALRKRYLLSQATVIPESSFRAFEAFTGRHDRERLLVDVLDLREQMLLYLMFEGVRGISLHVRFSEIAWERFETDYKFVTILRDPVDRFVSHYNWSREKPGAHARIEEPFDAFLDTDRARRLGATYVEYFCGLPKEADITGSEAIARAGATLGRFDVVGSLSDLPAFTGALRRELGVRIRIGHENRARTSTAAVTARTLTPAQRERVEALCAPDIAVWQAARTCLSGPETRTSVPDPAAVTPPTGR